MQHYSCRHKWKRSIKVTELNFGGQEKLTVLRVATRCHVICNSRARVAQLLTYQQNCGCREYRGPSPGILTAMRFHRQRCQTCHYGGHKYSLFLASWQLCFMDVTFCPTCSGCSFASCSSLHPSWKNPGLPRGWLCWTVVAADYFSAMEFCIDDRRHNWTVWIDTAVHTSSEACKKLANRWNIVMIWLCLASDYRVRSLDKVQW
jgi:hypothetical protein